MHVAGVYDGETGETRIYANGELKDTHAGPTGTVNPGQVAGIGRNGDEDRFFLGSDVDEIALMPSTTISFNTVATGMVQSGHLKPGDHVLTSNHEHAGGLLGWEHYAYGGGGG